jgi:hypothetical protein
MNIARMDFSHATTRDHQVIYQRRGISPVPGLFFLGLPWQTHSLGDRRGSVSSASAPKYIADHITPAPAVVPAA